MARIFLSYAREDLQAAQAFAGALEGAGHQVWWDHHLRAGSRFSWDIDAALRGAEAVVVLWSKDSVESAWVQDEAAEGLEGARLVPVALDGSRPPLGFRQYHTVDMARWRDGATFGALAAAVEGKLSGKEVGAPPPAREPTPAQPCICVLPFANKSGDPEQSYFSDGITEDVITDLSKISALSVLGHNASVGLQDQAVDLKQLAGALGATHVVEGTVRKSASRLRITAHLVEISSGRTLWAERYERELSDVFAIQDEISHAIGEALQLTLLPHEKSAIAEGRTSSAEAYDRYLKARGLWPAGAGGDYRKNEEVVRLCTEASAIDPNYANAWALLALASAELRLWHGRPLDALTPADRATALDDELSEPHCVRARHFEEQGRSEEAEAALQIALRLNPESWEANREAGQLLFRRGACAEAIAYFEKAVAKQRADHASASLLIVCLGAIGDEAGIRHAAQIAVRRSEQLIICDPASGGAYASAAHGFGALGECDRARKWIRKGLTVDPGNLAMRYVMAATAANCLEDEDQALEIIEPFVEAARLIPHLQMLEHDPSWARIRDGAAFQAILQRVRKRIDTFAVSY